MSSQQSYQKKLFFIGAIYNWAAAALFVALYCFSQEHLSLLVKIPEQTVWFFCTFMAVAIFGLGYFFIYRDVERNRDLITLGCLGKALFFLIFLFYWQKGDISTLAFALASGDAIFSILFAQVLCTLRKNRTQGAY